MKSGGAVIEGFHLPPGPLPAAVVKAREQFDKSVAAYREAEQAFNEVRAEMPSEFAPQAVRVAAEAAIAPRLGPVKIAFDKAAAEVDEKGDALCHAVEKERDAWLASVEEAEEAATERLRVALDEVREACEALAVPRAAIAWLDQWRLARALTGDISGRASGFRFQEALADLEELVNGPEPKQVGWQRSEQGHMIVSAPIFEHTDRRGRVSRKVKEAVA